MTEPNELALPDAESYLRELLNEHLLRDLMASPGSEEYTEKAVKRVMAELDRLRAEPVLAPNALDASAERWQLYAADLEVKLGELRAELERTQRAVLVLPEWHCPSCGAVTRARMADRPKDTT